MARTAITPGASLGLGWTDEVKVRLKNLLLAHPRAGIEAIAAEFRVSRWTMRQFLQTFEEAEEMIVNARAQGDSMIAKKNFAMAMKGDNKAMDREMKKRGMLGNDLLPVNTGEAKRDYSKLSVEELEELDRLDAKTRIRPTGEGALREIAPPLHS